METTGEIITLGLTKTVTRLGYANYKALYLDWWNNFLSTEGFASHHNISYDLAYKLLENAYMLYGS